MTPIVYTKREVRTMFQASDRSLERWVKQGRFPAPILPGRWDKQQVDQWRGVKLRHSLPSSDTEIQNYGQECDRL